MACLKLPSEWTCDGRKEGNSWFAAEPLSPLHATEDATAHTHLCPYASDRILLSPWIPSPFSFFYSGDIFPGDQARSTDWTIYSYAGKCSSGELKMQKREGETMARLILPNKMRLLLFLLVASSLSLSLVPRPQIIHSWICSPEFSPRRVVAAIWQFTNGGIGEILNS